MSITHVANLSQFRQLLSSSGNRLVVVDFTASWCGPCRMIAPVFESLAQQYSGRAVFVKVDVDEATDVAEHCSVSAMPTFHGYKSGRMVFNFSGADRTQLEEEIAAHAPSSAEVSFAGSGQVLGSSSAGPPKVNWDASPADRRAAAAAAAARRFGSTGTPSDPQPSSASGSGAPGPSSASTLLGALSAEDEIGAAASAEAGVSASANAASAPTSEEAVDATMLASLLEMGFPRPRAVRALRATSNRSTEVAMDWCFEHADDAAADAPLTEEEDRVKVAAASASASTEEAVKEPDAAAAPALSPEERAKKAGELMKKAREKRLAEEKAAELERERNRLRVGKDVTSAKAKHEEQQRKRMIEERRKEKLARIEERRRIRERIEADKIARHRKFHMGGDPLPEAVEEPPKPAPKVEQASPSGGKIQFRLPDGSRMERSFEPDDTIMMAAQFVAEERPDLAGSGFKLTQQYPKRVFGAGDMAMTLADAQLLPRGVLNVQFM